MAPRKKINQKIVPLIFNKSINNDKIFCSPTHAVIYPVTLEAVPVDQCSNFTLNKHFDSDLLCQVSREIKSKQFQKHSSISSKYPTLHFTERKMSSDTIHQLNSSNNKAGKIIKRTKSAEVIKLRSDKNILNRHLIGDKLDDELESKLLVYDYNTSSKINAEISTTNLTNIDKDSHLEKIKIQSDTDLNKKLPISKLNTSIQKKNFSADDSTDSELEPISPNNNNKYCAYNYVNNDQSINTQNKTLIPMQDSYCGNKIATDHSKKQIQMNINNCVNHVNNSKNNINNCVNYLNNSKDNINNCVNHLNNCKDNINNYLTDIQDNMHDTWNQSLIIPTILTPHVPVNAKINNYELTAKKNNIENHTQLINNLNFMNTNLTSGIYNLDNFVANTPPYQYDWSFRQKQLKNIYVYN